MSAPARAGLQQPPEHGQAKKGVAKPQRWQRSIGGQLRVETLRALLARGELSAKVIILRCTRDRVG
jgi:hypothetical protein